MKTRLLIGAFLGILACNPLSAKTWFVNLAATGTQSGASWANAFTTLQPAINAAASGDSIFVAKGTYYPTVAADGISVNNRDKAFVLKNDTRLFGGFAGTETNFAARATDSNSLHVTNRTTLSGNLGNAADSTDNAYHVVISVGLLSFIFDGFTVADGYADGLTPLMIGGRAIGRHYGGGVFNDSTIGGYSNVVFANNTAKSFNAEEGGGGGMYNYKGSLTIFTAVFFRNHAQNANGGGMKNNASKPSVLNSHFYQNTASTDDEGGGAINNVAHSDAVFNNLLIEENWTDGSGGGVYNDSSFPLFTNSIFRNNTAEVCGGGMDMDNGSNGNLSNVLFTGNTAGEDGGGLYGWKSDVTLNAVRFIGNHAVNNGGGMYNYNTCNPKLTYTIFTKNTAGNNYGGFGLERNSTATITNTLFSRNQAVNNGGGLGSEDNHGSAATLILTNVTVVNNSASSGGGGYDYGTTTQLRNSIVFGNYPDDVDINPLLILNVRKVIVNDGSGPVFFSDGSVSTTGVSVSSFIFIDTANSDYRLIAGSPAIDAGDSSFYSSSSTPNLSTVKTDLLNVNRIMGKNVDLGCYEFCTNTVTPTAVVSVAPGSVVPTGIIVVFQVNTTNAGANPIIKWWKNNTVIAGATSVNYGATAGTDFMDGDSIWATVRSLEPCTVPDTAKSNKIAMHITSSVQNTPLTTFDLSVAPNPNNGAFTLNGHFAKDKTYNLIITDVTGRSIYQESFKLKGNEKQVALPATVPGGVYLLSVKEKNQGQQTIRLIVK